MGWTALSGLAPVYPLYALLFLDAGLSQAEVSGLFALWSVTAFLAEVPAGVLADRWSRRGALVLSGVLEAVAFGLWTSAPGAASFAAGFVVWGVGGALASGTVEAVLYDGLASHGAADAFPRVHGWTTAAELLVQVPTAGLATVLVVAGGYELVGWVSVALCLATAALALRFPSPPPAPEPGGEDGGEDGQPLRWSVAVAVALRRPALRLVVLAVALLGGLDAIEEYLPVMARDWGVPQAAVPGTVLAVALAGALGAALGGRAARLPTSVLLGMLAGSGVLLAAAAGWARPAAVAVLAVAYGLYLAVLVVAEARLQERITGPYRATLTSVAGVGIELASLLVFAAWAVGGPPVVAVLFLAAVPLVAMASRSSRTAPRPGAVPDPR
ncbi:MFS transporter [Blastococcus sp. TF02A-26]|uniref:MFS transporter n=1 Tax=Blastococcus sp. TF02A-26 TaxID=2250577 RepID=UPI000DE813CA|nr:MFS transporter [Blastococcus sp. TF02A-26]RBY87495.1 MFS transporter [Blastococcus sp. TF02A-26]